MRRGVDADENAPAAVIGASGFLGVRLTDALAAAGVPTARFTRGTPPVLGGRAAPGLRRARVVFFLASSITPAVAADRPGRVAEDQAFLSLVLEALRREDGRPAFVLASSGGTVYAPDAPLPYTELSPVRPVCAYGRAKLRSEQMLLARTGAVWPIIVRIATVYGPGQRPRGAQGVIAHWLAAAQDHRPLQVYGDSRVGRDYVYIDDVTRALVALYRYASTADGDPLTLNIGSGVRTVLIDLLATVVQTVGAPLTVEFCGARPFDRADVWLDVTAARRTLRWRPHTTVDSGVPATWQALRHPVTVHSR